MKIHHLNCGTLCPFGASLLNGEGEWYEPARLVCHCLLIEGRSGLVLVDTGLGLDDVARPAERLGGVFTAVTRPAALKQETAVEQVKALGFSVQDVRHLVLTHLDLDHAGGIADFPGAEVHVHLREHMAAMRPTLRERERYRRVHWAHQPRWRLHSAEGERWFDFDAVRALDGTDDSVLLIPLHGHTRGHCGVAVRDAQGWVLHAGDAYFHRGEVNPEAPPCPPGLRIFQSLVEIDRATRLANQERLRQLVAQHGPQVRVTCAHDPIEFERARLANSPPCATEQSRPSPRRPYPMAAILSPSRLALACPPSGVSAATAC